MYIYIIISPCDLSVIYNDFFKLHTFINYLICLTYDYIRLHNLNIFSKMCLLLNMCSFLQQSQRHLTMLSKNIFKII